MGEKSYKFFWNGNFVGEMLNPNFDMFETYGKWKSANLPATTVFLNELINEKQLTARFDDAITGKAGIIEFFPDEEIQVKHYPNLD